MSNKTEHKVRNHRFTDWVSDESDSNGIWVYLKPGFIWTDGGIGCIHESSWTKCLKLLNNEVSEIE
jgi:hypothetical protein